jgi:integrase
MLARYMRDGRGGNGETFGVVVLRGASSPVQAWQAAVNITESRLLRRVGRHGNVGAALSEQSVNLILKRRGALAGVDAAELLSGHSLRRGFCTSSAQAGVEERDIMRVSRHRSAMVLRRYIDAATVVTAVPAGKLGL